MWPLTSHIVGFILLCVTVKCLKVETMAVGFIPLVAVNCEKKIQQLTLAVTKICEKIATFNLDGVGSLKTVAAVNPWCCGS